MKEKIVTFKVDPRMKLRLTHIARFQNKTTSAVVRDALDYYLNKPKNKGKSTRLKMAKRAEKENLKGPKDLSKNMNKYLYG